MVAFDKFIWNDGNRFEGIESLAYKTTYISISIPIYIFFEICETLLIDFSLARTSGFIITDNTDGWVVSSFPGGGILRCQ